MFRTGLATLAFCFVATVAQAQQPPATELTAQSFTRNPAIWAATMSPDGRYVAAIQESSLGDALTIIDWRTRVAQVTQLARRERSLHLDWVAWKSDDRVIFALRQEASRDNAIATTRVYASNRDGTALTLMFGGEMRQRLAFDYAPVQLIDKLANDPDHILLGTFAQHGYTVYRADVGSGRVDTIVDFADWDTVGMVVDSLGYPVMRIDVLSGNTGWQMYRRGNGQHDWTLAFEIRRSSDSENRAFFPLGPGPGPSQVYVAARPGEQEFQSIYLYNTATGEFGAPVFSREHADAAGAWLDPNDHSVLVGCAETQRWECRATQPDIQRHLDALNAYFHGDADITLRSASRDGRYWLVLATAPTLPTAYYVYDHTTSEISFVASTQPSLPQDQLARTRVVEYASRDGTSLWGYLTEPSSAGPHPLVVFPHGGPEARDSYDYDFYVQFLAWRGYSVFQPNFRGSEGSGRSFAEAGHRQWGRRMQDDITDGVEHLIAAGAVDHDRICIVGASYGGYAALAGATLTPDLYKCAISIAGVSDLPAMLATERHDGGQRSPIYEYWTQLIGDPVADRDALIAMSPARQAAQAHIPILLLHGTDDTTVPFAQSELMRDALHAAGKDVVLTPIQNEGHIWSEWTRENRQRLLEETDRFLSANIGN